MISIVCPIYNEEKYIDEFIKSILSQDYPKDDLEVILVDGMSTDKTRDIIKSYSEVYPFIRLIDNVHRIVSPAMNLGVKAAKGDIIIRLDAHAVFPCNYFSELVKYLNLLNADNVGGVCRTLPINNSVVSRAIANVLGSPFGMGNSHFRIGVNKIQEVDTVPFGCFHRDLFNRIGHFDEELIRNQDDEFNGRIVKNGGKIYILPHLVIDYYARDSVKKLFQMFYQYGLFKPLVNKKLGSPATLRQFAPLFFVIGIIFGPLFGFISPIFLIIYSTILILYFLFAASYSLSDSREFKLILTQSLVYFIVHFAYGWGYVNGLLKLMFGRPFNVAVNR